MRYSFCFILLMGIILTACNTTITLEPTNTPQPTSTIEPTQTSTSTPQPTSTSTPTETPGTIFNPNGIERLAVADGFTISVPVPLLHQADKNIILVGNEDRTFTVSFASDAYDGVQPLSDVIDIYLASLEKRGWQTVKGESTNIEVDGFQGIVTDLAGTAGNTTFEGQAVAVSPSSDLVLFGLGISTTDVDKDSWTNFGSPAFEGLLDRIKFSNDEAACPVSTDQTYGFTEANPIQIGGDAFGGPSRERAYLEHLRGPNGEELSYEREGSIPTDTTILDGYKITGPGINVTLYLDIYNYSLLQAPVGFTCTGAFPFSAP